MVVQLSLNPLLPLAQLPTNVFLLLVTDRCMVDLEDVPPLLLTVPVSKTVATIVLNTLVIQLQENVLCLTRLAALLR
jgi:hypothetical protein